MMLAASFEASVRTDASDRVACRTKDAIRKPFRDLYEKYDDRVRLEDILDLWQKHVAVGAAVNQKLRKLLKHRHWLAHGRHYIDHKSGMKPSPWEAKSIIDDYLREIRAGAPDFPRI